MCSYRFQTLVLEVKMYTVKEGKKYKMSRYYDERRERESFFVSE